MALPPGLYVVKSRSSNKGVDHYGIVDCGNRLGLLRNRNVFNPRAVVLVHQTPPAVRFETLPDGIGPEWIVGDPIRDEEGARARLNAILADPRYDVLSHNCEHFVWYVATGEKKSPQLRGVAAVVGAGALIWWLGNREN